MTTIYVRILLSSWSRYLCSSFCETNSCQGEVWQNINPGSNVINKILGSITMSERLKLVMWLKTFNQSDDWGTLIGWKFLFTYWIGSRALVKSKGYAVSPREAKILIFLFSSTSSEYFDLVSGMHNFLYKIDLISIKKTTTTTTTTKEQKV